MNVNWRNLLSVVVLGGALVAAGVGGAWWFWRDPGTDLITLPPAINSPVPLVELHATTKGGIVRWLVVPVGASPAATLLSASTDNHTMHFGSVGQGQWVIYAWTSVKNVATDAAICTVTVGNVPPGPGPGPNPPGPAPIPDPGLHVLMVYESETTLTPPQRLVLTSQLVRDWLNTHCVKGPDGKTPEWRIWDANTNVTAESKSWQNAMARKRDKLPWIIISNPSKGGGYEGPLPESISTAIEKLSQYAN